MRGQALSWPLIGQPGCCLVAIARGSEPCSRLRDPSARPLELGGLPYGSGVVLIYLMNSGRRSHGGPYFWASAASSPPPMIRRR